MDSPVITKILHNRVDKFSKTGFPNTISIFALISLYHFATDLLTNIQRKQTTTFESILNDTLYTAFEMIFSWIYVEGTWKIVQK